jgi:cell division protein FtsX
LKTGHGNGRDEREDPTRPRNGFAVLMLAALVAFCLSIMSLGGATAERFASALETRLSGQITIVIWGQGLESADAAAARAAERLMAQAGVRKVTILDADGSDATLGALIAGRSLGADGPRVLSLDGSPNAIPSAAALQRTLAADGMLAAADDHRGAMGPLETRALLGADVAGAMGVSLVIGLFAASLASGFRRVAAARARFDLMSRLGASPTFIGATVGGQFGSIAVAGGVVGALFADLVLLAATVDRGLWRTLGAPVYARPDLRDSLWTAASPLVVMAIATLGGGLGARRAIELRERRM